MSGTRDAQHVDSVRPQSFVSTIGHTRTDMVFVFVDNTHAHNPAIIFSESLLLIPID
jgi:hypothetical protein